MATYALIENASGFIWAVLAAESAEAACAAATLLTGGIVAEYEEIDQFSSSEENGYVVYEVDDDWTCDGGTDEVAIAELSARRSVGCYTAVAAESEF